MTLAKLKNWYLPITEELDKYRILKDSLSKTYLYGNENGVEISEYGLIAIRVPGATRGHIKVDENLIIQDLVIYQDSYKAAWACYTPEVLEVKTKFIGTKLNLPKYYMPQNTKKAKK